MADFLVDFGDLDVSFLDLPRPLEGDFFASASPLSEASFLDLPRPFFGDFGGVGDFFGEF